ncbi:MAG: Fis family transcriptional regulator, partial [Proteobacteria bacterium]|nr:Fis family transcriptional regulator [Pseudomonadota bacterium]
IKLPPLRERRDDILSLAQHFLQKYNEAYGTHKRLSRGAAEALCAYPFPGNVRELEGTIKNAIVLSESDVLDAYISSILQSPSGGDTGLAPEGTRKDLAAEVKALEKRLLLEASRRCSTTREMADYLGTSQPSVVRKLRRHRIRAVGRGRGSRRSMQD